MTARSRERGSHAGRPRSYGLPFTVPLLSVLGTSSLRHGSSTLPSPAQTSPAQAPPAGETPRLGDGQEPQAAAAPNLAPAPSLPPSAAPRRPAAPQAHRSRHRHRKPQQRRSFAARLPKHTRLVTAVVVTAGVLAVGFLDGGFGGQGDVEPTVEAFLYDWQQGDYAQAAALTNGTASDVTAQLAAAYTDLNATSEFFAMRGITQHGATAVATYFATVDLAEGGQQWSYTGTFNLTARHGNWTVDWSPSVINPSLGPGDRLAVDTSYAPRAPILDSSGTSLITTSTDYQVGLYPGKLKHAAATAARFSAITRLDEQQVLGQIQAAPPGDFLSMLTLSPANFAALWPMLSTVPGLSYRAQSGRLFTAPSARDGVGGVGTEDTAELRMEGVAYQPGTTVGLSGLEAAYQSTLAGTPTTTVEVVNAAGHVTKRWPLAGGHPGTPVRTTLDAREQASAASALAGQQNSAEIVAVDSATGAIRAIATQSGGDVPLPGNGPLDAKIQPGMAFSIVSAAALLSAGVAANSPLPCEPVADVDGMTFTYQPATAATSTFAADFADGCGTAFANMSRNLTSQQLASTERAFGIGSSWQLPLSWFSGSAPATSGEPDLAAQVTGTGGVLMSPLGMAEVAAEVASGTGHSPVIIPTDRSTSWEPPLSATGLTELRQLMRLAVTSGTAHAADVPGTPVYGQSGVVQTGKHSYLSWFVGYRGSTAVAVLETGKSASQAAAALAGTFLKTVS